MVRMSTDELASGVRDGAARALGRALSVVEDGGEEARALLAALGRPRSAPHVVGVTGPPGAGKSSLVEHLGRVLAADSRLAVIAVDPSSPFTGGALLADRLRMPTLTTTPGCFVRSMATRGALGGLTAATADAVDVLAAAGYPTIVVETVGVGQDEVDVMHLVDTVVLTIPPGLGDDVQAAKAGVMEIADILVVSKSDVPGADQAAAWLRAMLELAPVGDWTPPVLSCSARDGSGVAELAAAIADHRAHLGGGGRHATARRARAERRIVRAVQDLARRRVERASGGMQTAVDAVLTGALDPYTAAEQLLGRIGGDDER